MPDLLLPLNALRAFEAAARHLSFKRAADELHVTPAAIGHQIKNLEDFLGVPLFRRLNRAVLLTDAAQACLPDLREGFERLAAGVSRIRAYGGRRLLVVNVAPTFAIKWLVPRLTHFQDQHPDITVRVETTTAMVDLTRGGVDLAIRFCGEVAAGLAAETLFDEEIAPVCAPRLMEGKHPLRRPEDLRTHTLLHVEGESTDPSQPSWQTWLEASGVADVGTWRGLHFTQTVTAAQAAIDGQGVALLGQTCLLDDLAAGRLIRPFALGFPVAYAYRMVSPRAAFDRPKVKAFRAWLRAEAEASLQSLTRP
jgi:LysR family transcriptional regulator, glycine cleavage system transcriptional activator